MKRAVRHTNTIHKIMCSDSIDKLGIKVVSSCESMGSTYVCTYLNVQEMATVGGVRFGDCQIHSDPRNHDLVDLYIGESEKTAPQQEKQYEFGVEDKNGTRAILAYDDSPKNGGACKPSTSLVTCLRSWVQNWGAFIRAE